MSSSIDSLTHGLKFEKISPQKEPFTEKGIKKRHLKKDEYSEWETRKYSMPTLNPEKRLNLFTIFIKKKKKKS